MVESGTQDIWRVVPRVLNHFDSQSIELIAESISEAIGFQGMRFVAMQAFLDEKRELASAYLLEYPGKLAALVGPSVVRDSSRERYPDAEKAVLVELVNRARGWGVEILQAVIEDDSPFPTHSLLGAGLSKLSTLFQMAVDFPPTGLRRDPMHSGVHVSLEWKRYSPADNEAWIDWMDATYVRTADCPELNGLRTTASTLEGYLASSGTSKVGATSPEWWAAFEKEPSIAGIRPPIISAFMLSDTGGRFWELSYMGVVPGHRGRGLGHTTLLRAMTRAQELNAKRLTLAVDCRNSFAIRLYQLYGFQRTRQLEAWFLAFRN